ncbi:endonuclease YncB(thermonuclease family) [Arthrobacter sp. UYNi723]
MNTHTRTAKFIGAGVLAGSLFAALTGCASGQATPAPDNGTPGTASATPTQAQPESLRGTFVSVVDGDTIELLPVSDKDGKPTGAPKTTVHILGIDAPAIDACGGPEAAAELKRVINVEGFFRVTYDPKSARTDSHGNAQGYLTANDGSGSPNDIGSTLIKNGFAGAWYEKPQSEPEPRKFADYTKAAQIAKGQKVGAWATCGTVGKTLTS